MEDQGIEFISLDQSYVLMTDGTVLPIAEYLDDDGDDCEPDCAAFIVAGSDEYGWLTIEIEEETEAVTFH